MKRIFRWLAIVSILASLSSCGLPGAAVRSAGRLANAAGDLVGPAAAAAAL